MAKQPIQLSDHFTYGRLVRFTLPSIAMMIFTSIYGVVDGFFVSNFVGKTPFAAVNFIMPVLMMLGCLGFMFGTGGSALVAMTMGMGNRKKAREIFSLLIYVTIGSGVVLAALGILFLPNIAALLGAEGQMLADCILYGRIILLALPALMLQFAFQSFFVTAEKPQLGLAVTLAAGITNMVLDALFIAVLEWGLVGAAAATAFSQVVGGIIPLFYFARSNGSALRLGKTRWDRKALLKTCTNGSSELMSNISMSLVSMLYNIQLMKYAGENGVAAYGVLMYVCFVFLAIFIGYSVGVAPVIGFHYGAANYEELKGLRQKSLRIIALCAVAMFLLAEFILARPLALLFVGYDQALMELTLHAFRIFAFLFLFAGFAIFGSAFFTALNNGLISALISFLRSLVFEASAVFLLPLLFGLDGIWLSTVAADLVAATLAQILKTNFANFYSCNIPVLETVRETLRDSIGQCLA
ncbi:MAG: MATE family efflux transporter, partial [Ruminiclostridium sp.]|nr:MATE family efflux transporter [Ruminiclostridium sp.]